MDPANAGHSRDVAATRSRAWATEAAARRGRDDPRGVGTDDTSRRANRPRETRRPALEERADHRVRSLRTALLLRRREIREDDLREQVGLHVALAPGIVPGRGGLGGHRLVDRLLLL